MIMRRIVHAEWFATVATPSRGLLRIPTDAQWRPILTAERDEDLEEMMLELGRTRYRNNTAKASIKGRRTDTKSGRALLREAVVKLADGVKVYRRRAKKRAGAGHSSARLLEG